MFKNVVNYLLQRFLEPYFEGISDISLGLGNVELKELKLKPSLLAACGIDVLEVEHGQLQSLSLRIPLSSLIFGKIDVGINGLQLVASTRDSANKGPGDEEELLRQLRENRRCRVQVRTAQLREKLNKTKIWEATAKAGEKVEDKASLGAKFVRQLVESVSVTMDNMSCKLRNVQADSAFEAKVVSIFLVSPPTSNDLAPGAKHNLQKTMGIEGLQIVGGCAGCQQHMLRPFAANLVLFQDLANNEIRVDLKVGSTQDSGIALRQIQGQLLLQTIARLGEQSARLQALLTPANTEMLVDLSTAEAVQKVCSEFEGLVRRENLENLNMPAGTDELTDADKWRLQLLWDVVPEENLARWMLPVINDMELVAKQRAYDEAQKNKRRGWFAGLFSQQCESPSDEEIDEAFSSIARQTEALDAIEAPNRFVIHGELQSFRVHLIASDEDPILDVLLAGSIFHIDVLTRPDHRGVPTAEWSLSYKLHGTHVMHLEQQIVKHGRVTDIDSSDGKEAFSLGINNKLEKQRTLFSVIIECEPVELIFVQSLIPCLVKYQSALSETLTKFSSQSQLAPDDKRAKEVLAGYFHQGQQWLESSKGQESLSQARERIPDALELHISLAGPTFQIQGSKADWIWISLGNLVVQTSDHVNSQGAPTNLQVIFCKTQLAIIDPCGQRCDILAPFTLKACVEQSEVDMNVDLEIDGFAVSISPRIVRNLVDAVQRLAASCAVAVASSTEQKESQQLQQQQQQQPTAATSSQQQSTDLAESPQHHCSTASGDTHVFFEKLDKTSQELSARRLRNIQILCSCGKSTIMFLRASTTVLRLAFELQKIKVLANMSTDNGMPAVSATGDLYTNVDIFNDQVGRFEPLLESFGLSCRVVHKGNDRVLVKVLGLRPLLVNLTLAAIQQFAWYVPLLMCALQVDGEAESLQVPPDRYRLLNLTGGQVNLTISGVAKTTEIAAVPHSFCSLSSEMLGTNADFINIESEVQLSLLRVGSTCVHAQLLQVLKPHPDHVLILISNSCLLLNCTSLDIQLSFPDSVAEHICCASCSFLSGEQCNDHIVSNILKPNCFTSIPTGGAASTNNEGMWLSRCEIQPENGILTVIGHKPAHGMLPVDCGDVHLLAKFQDSTTAPPAARTFRQISLLPALHLCSIFPGDLHIQFHMQSETEACARTSSLPAFSESLVYTIPTPGIVMLRARIDNGIWSSWCKVSVGESCEQYASSSVERDLSVQADGTAKASLTVTTREGNKVCFYCSSWLLDKTGWNLSVHHGGLPLPVEKGIYFCNSSHDGYELVADGQLGKNFSIPVGRHESGIGTLSDGRQVCTQSVPLLHDQAHGFNIRCIELRPRLILNNATTDAIEFTTGDASCQVAPGTTYVPLLVPGLLRFRKIALGNHHWSCALPTDSVAAGVFPFVCGKDLFTVEVRPDGGSICMLVREGSDFSVLNSLNTKCELRIRGCDPEFVEAGGHRMFAWIDPFGIDQGRMIEILSIGGASVRFDPRVSHPRALGTSAMVISVLQGDKTCLEVVPPSQTKQPNTEVHVELLVPNIGVSLVTKFPSTVELLHLELQLLRACVALRPCDDVQLFEVTAGDLQLDWRSKDSTESKVLLGNSGISASNKLRPFFRLAAERGRTSSTDIFFHAIHAEIDEFEVHVDTEVFTSIAEFVHMCRPVSYRPDLVAGSAVLAELRRKAGVSIICDNWNMPPLEVVVQLEFLSLSDVAMSVWSSVLLTTLTFIPKWLRTLLTALTLSSSLTLAGSKLKLSDKRLTSIRGCITDVLQSLGRQYIGDIIKSLGSVLGRSSLLNIPKAPLMLGGTVGSIAAEAVHVSTEKTFDAMEKISFMDYGVHRKSSRHPTGISSSLTLVLDDMGDGCHGLLDALQMPIHAARDGGVKGFFKGLGLGAVCSVARPLSAMGYMVNDLGAGVAAELAQLGTIEKKVTTPCRLPRLFVGPLKATVEFSDIDAWIVSVGKIETPVEALMPLRVVEAPHCCSPDGTNETAEAKTDLSVLVLGSAEVYLMTITAFQSDPQRSERISDKMSTSFRQAEGVVQWRSGLPLRSVSWNMCENGAKPGLLIRGCCTRTGQGNEYIFPAPWDFGAEVVEALFTVLSKATRAVQGDWTHHLRQALQNARHKLDTKEQVSLCEVYEVQRAKIASGTASEWVTPFLPHESEQQYRWLDRHLHQRHPLLDDATDVGQAKVPPIVMLPIWKPTEEWKVIRSQHTDMDGWQYAPAWGCPVWRTSPRSLFDMVRRRQWQREYRLVGIMEETAMVSEEWLHAAARSPRGFSDMLAQLCCCKMRPQSQKHTKDKSPQ